MNFDVKTLNATFVGTHYVDSNYHRKHSQLIHLHKDVIELLLIIEGTGTYIVNGKTYVVRPGSLVVCNAGVLHGEAPNDQHSMMSCCCVLKNLQLPGLPPNTLIGNHLHPVLFFDEDMDDIAYTMRTLHSLHKRSPEYDVACQMLANAILQMILIKMNHREQYVSHGGKRDEDLIRNITEYLDEHFTEHISLPEMGEVFHMSHFHLAHIYKTETGIPPMKYVLYRRIGEAQNLLMNTDLSIGEISDRLGFGDRAHFNTMFKKYVDRSPTQYRKYFKQSQNEKEGSEKR